MEQPDLTPFFRTKKEADNFMATLSNISDKVFETDFNLDKTLEENFGLETKDKFLSFLREQNISVSSAKDLIDFFDKLILDISNIPILYLNIAFSPTQDTL